MNRSCGTPPRVHRFLFFLFLLMTLEAHKITYDILMLKRLRPAPVPQSRPNHRGSSEGSEKNPPIPRSDFLQHLLRPSLAHASPPQGDLNCGPWCKHTDNRTYASWRHKDKRVKQRAPDIFDHPLPDYSHHFLQNVMPAKPKLFAQECKDSPFDTLACATINPHRVRFLATPEELEPLEVVWTPGKLESFVDKGSTPSSTKPSTLSFSNFRKLFDQGLFAVTTMVMLGLVSFFGVFKASGSFLRPIANPELNSRFSWPKKWKLKLPSPVDILSTLFQASIAICFDFKSWFCQIPLCHTARRFFCFTRFGLKLCLAVLPQGWLASPPIAQALTNIVTKGISETLSWIDNIVITASSSTELDSKISRFLSRCRVVGAVLKDLTAQPTTLVTFVGFHCCLLTKRWKADPEWSSKVAPRLTSICNFRGKLPVRIWWHLAGSIFWYLRVTQTPLAFLTPVKQWMSETAILMDKNQLSWSTPILLPAEVRMNILPYVTLLSINPWHSWTFPISTFDIVTDASTKGGAFLSALATCWFSWTFDFTSDHIFWLELLTIWAAVIFHSKFFFRSRFVVHSDNKACVDVLSNMSAHHPLADWIIGRIYLALQPVKCQLQMTYIPSELNPADPWSRILRPPGSFSLSLTNCAVQSNSHFFSPVLMLGRPGVRPSGTECAPSVHTFAPSPDTERTVATRPTSSLFLFEI